MAIALTPNVIQQIIAEVEEEQELRRRALMKRRHDIFRDGGKEFLLEQLVREFGRNAQQEFRIAPLNFLKKIINKRSTLYKSPPERTAQTGLESDQALIDFWTEELDLNELMGKANRYFNLFSNTALYPVPSDNTIKLFVTPPYLYSVVPNKIDQTRADLYAFNAFVEEGQIKDFQATGPAGGKEGFSRDRGFKGVGDLVDSREFESQIESRKFIMWTENEHVTVNAAGERQIDSRFINEDGTIDETQFLNPIAPIIPVVNLAKDRDNEFWATQGEDMVDVSLLLQLAWTDLMTVAKHQGFAQMVVKSAEEPKTLQVGVTKVIHLKIDPGVPETKDTSVDFISPNSPLQQYKDVIMELLGLLLSTNDLNPKEIGGTGSARSFSSGFQALIETADTLEARKMDMAPMRRAEQELWQIVAAWHNFMFDNNALRDDARALGKFSDGFGINIKFADVKPLESDQERLAVVEKLMDLKLASRKDALKKLNPDLSSSDIEAKLQEIDEQRMKNAATVMQLIPPGLRQASEEEQEEEQEQDGEES